MTDPSAALPAIPTRKPESHKGDFGSALLIGGAEGMAGAIALGAIAALRSGAGRVTASTPCTSQNVVASFEPAVMTRGLPATEEGFFAKEAYAPLMTLSAGMSAAGCGPGMGRSPSLTELTEKLYAEFTIPTVMDADALFALAEIQLPAAKAPRILTPHAGEWARLSGTTAATRQVCEDQVRSWAEHHRVIVILKGHHTLVTDGQRAIHNTTGNPGMATAGSGDVLTGVITGLLAQGLSAWNAAQLGVYLHGLAGDIALRAKGPVALIASDLLDALPAAIEQHRADG